MFIADIKAETLQNNNYRKVLHTAPHMQLVIMCLQPNQEIGAETHSLTDQFIRIEEGTGKAVINDTEYELKDDSVVIIPAGANHNIINTSTTNKLKLYTIYTPPNHNDGLVQITKPITDQDGGSGKRYYKFKNLF